MRTGFDDLAAVHHQDSVSRADGVEPVGDDENGASAQEFFDSGPNLEFLFRVEVGGGFIQNEIGSIFQNLRWSAG